MAAEIAQAFLQRGRPLVVSAFNGKTAGVLAFRIVRTADEAAVAAKLQPQPALVARRAQPRIAAALLGREEMLAEIGVKRVDNIGDLQILGLGDRRREILPERPHDSAPIGLAGGDVVELLLQTGGKPGVHISLEEAGQERRHQTPAVFRNEPTLVDLHIVPLLQNRQDRGVGGGAADAELLHLLHQASFGKPRRRLGEVLVGGNRGGLGRIALGHRRQHTVVFVFRAFLGLFAIKLEEAVERQDRAIGAQLGAISLGGLGEIDDHLVELGRLHLRGNGPLPDQLIKPPLVGAEIALHRFGRAGHIGRADRLMRFLGVLRLGSVFARLSRNVALAELFLHVIADRQHRLARHLHAVGSHVGDQTRGIAVDIHTLIQPLGEAHDLLRAEAQLARGVLLQGGGCERRRRIALDPAPLNGCHRERAGFHLRLGAGGLFGVVDVELVELLAVQMGQPRGERCSGRRGQPRLDAPVFPRLEDLDLRLALTDQPQRHRLHASCRTAAGQFAPQHRRQREAHQIIQRAPRHVGLDQRLIEFTRVVHRVAHGGAGDFVEGDALNVDALEELLVLQHRPHMPADRLALAIRIGCEIERLGALHRLGDSGDLALAALVGSPIHREIFIWPHAAIFRRQVADMTKARQHGEPGAEIFVDGLGFGGRFNDDDVGHVL